MYWDAQLPTWSIFQDKEKHSTKEYDHEFASGVSPLVFLIKEITLVEMIQNMYLIDKTTHMVDDDDEEIKIILHIMRASKCSLEGGKNADLD